MLMLTYCKRKKLINCYSNTSFKRINEQRNVPNCILYLVTERQSTIPITQYIDYYNYNVYAFIEPNYRLVA